jgi:hypothetical protein
MGQDVEAEQIVAFCTGTFWSKGDLKCNGDPNFFIKVPGKPVILDCTKAKHGKGHNIARIGQVSLANTRVESGEHTLLFISTIALQKDQELSFVQDAE